MNRIFPEQLNHHLAQGLARVYLLQGQDPLLLSETEDTLCQVANQQGFDEKILFRLIAKLIGRNL
ncbi:DNA polymerase III subunit delta [Haemophilus influenzae 22.4-21]|uniref:DNA polymerase III subunit delta n=1 Tax=Haemophilus influenzae 22.4-21 TaxID=375063 RepID=A4P028_HAEIF|nr:DNA polymerase III subunit delta [Haemophilus influenzae 22.4-21]